MKHKNYHIRKLILPLTTALLLTGCVSYTPASSHRLEKAIPYSINDDAWRVQDTSELQEAYDATPAVIDRYALVESIKRSDLTDAQRTALDRTSDVVSYKGIHAGRLLRIFETSETTEIGYHFKGFLPDEVIYGFTPNARLLTVEDLRKWKIDNPISKLKSDQATEASMMDLMTSHRLRLVDHSEMVPLNEGQAVRVPEMQQMSPKGVIIHFTALFGNKYETKLLAELRQSGWAVIDINTQTRVDPPPMNEEDQNKYDLVQNKIDDLDKRDAKARDEYFKMLDEHLNDEEQPDIPLQYRHWKELFALNQTQQYIRSFHTSNNTTIDDVGLQLAQAIDEVIAKNALAAEAVLDYARDARPDLPAHPTILLGLSAGSLVVPAAAARLGDRVDAAVMVGAGTDLFTITQKNPYSDGGIRVRDGDNQPSRKFMRELNLHYLKYTKLDPAKTAGALNDKPVLLMTGMFDSVVPARLGNDLYEILNKPDRISVPGGHGLVFFLLPGQSKRIEKWMEKHTHQQE